MPCFNVNQGEFHGIVQHDFGQLGFGNNKVEAAQQTALPAETAAIQEATAPIVQAISDVDVVAKHAALASASAEKLNWKVSIVDYSRTKEGNAVRFVMRKA